MRPQGRFFVAVNNGGHVNSFFQTQQICPKLLGAEARKLQSAHRRPEGLLHPAGPEEKASLYND